MTTSRRRHRSASGLATQDAPPLDLPFRFMATALGALALMALVYPWHLPLLLGSFYNAHLLTFVHVNTLGLIGATIMGASYQLLPVVLQRPLASVRLARLSWWLFLPGLVGFALGMSSGRTWLLAIGGTLLYLAIGLYILVVARTLARAPYRDVVYWHIAAAVIGLGTAATLGLLLAVSKALGFLGGLTLPTLAAHAALMLGGWVTPMLTGVAYRLVGMFTLSEDRFRRDWAGLELVLTVVGAWVLAGSLLFGLGRSASVIGALALLGGLALFAAHLGWLYRGRRRRTFDIHIPFALVATGYGLLSVALLTWGLASGRPVGDGLWLAVGWWAIAGWAETAIQGFLYKIGTFLTWLHRYAPLAGRQPVPRLEELYGRRTAVFGWGCWTLGAGLGGVAALTRLEPLAIVAAVSLSAGAAAFLVNAARVGRHWIGAPINERTSHQPAR